MIFSFVNIRGYGLNLLVDGVPEFEVFPYEIRISCLRRANDRFDRDIMHAASLYPEDEKGAYLWCYTALFLRGENVTDLIKLYYLLEIIYELNQKKEVKRVEIRFPIPFAAISELSAKGLIISYNLSEYVFGILYKGTGLIIKSLFDIRKNITHIFKKPNNVFNGNLLDVNKSPKENRLDILKNYEFYNPYNVYSGQEHELKGFSKHQTVNFRNELTCWDTLSAVGETWRINRFIAQNKTLLPAIYSAYIYNRFNVQLWSLLLYKKSVQKYFAKCSIDNLVHVSTLTKPEYRLLWAEAKKKQCRIILVSSRTLKVLSSSERLLPCDFDGYSGAILPDYFIFRDEFSKRNVFKNREDYLQRSYIGGRTIAVCDKETGESRITVNYAVLLMLTHQRKSSDQIISATSSVNLKELGIDTVIFRSHPSCRYTNEEIQKSFQEFKIINNHNQKPEDLLKFKTIMISGPTTGALEFAAYCSEIIWLPYIWSDGLLFDDMMNTIGTKIINNTDLSEILKFAIINSKNIASEKIDLFSSSALISDSIKKIIK